MLPVPLALIVGKVRIDVDEIDVLRPPAAVWLQRKQAAHRLAVYLDPACLPSAHVGQVDASDQVVARKPAPDRHLPDRAGEVVEGQVGPPLGAQDKRPGRPAGVAQEDRHRHHALGLEHHGEVEAILRQPVWREPAPVRLLLHDEQNGTAAVVAPLHQQRRVEHPEAVSQALLQLLLPNGDDLRRLFRRRRLFGREERERLARIVEDQVLEVLVVAERVRHVVRPGCLAPHGRTSDRRRATDDG